MEGRVRQGILGGNKFIQVVHHVLRCFATFFRTRKFRVKALADMELVAEGKAFANSFTTFVSELSLCMLFHMKNEHK